MARISVFEWYSRTADNKSEWALEYYEIDDIQEQLIEEWATPVIDENGDLEII
jgi:hypothetical protein